jgi:four helix bundle protein
MATFKQFEDIDAWRESRQLVRMVYRVTKDRSFANDRALRDQIRRASVSSTSNIAEGFERRGRAEFVYFLSVAKGSCGEVRSLLYVALDQGYIEQEAFDELYDQAVITIRKISGLLHYLESNRTPKRSR